ncbi:MAG: hypothetical protein JO303_09745 [Caulobacteraceae bacterium]|nr:hypothetical protein [Caulobacteraceae bacterium]
MTLYDHIQELRAELSNVSSERELRQIEAEMAAARAELAQHDAAFEAWLARLE